MAEGATVDEAQQIEATQLESLRRGVSQATTSPSLAKAVLTAWASSTSLATWPTFSRRRAGTLHAETASALSFAGSLDPRTRSPTLAVLDCTSIVGEVSGALPTGNAAASKSSSDSPMDPNPEPGEE